ncbi:16S rRNA (guanine527-N7)-methyltransferase [Aureimonas altamirensis DSM 21988]|nr:16S rRNA (guanine(527)-N(7))-methyltransferase RsmG [Aureimonas altamirensis]SHJ98594.1 16S rRNA (guanine527-N7)-methyltransferase [Aureimonas altamirensis DSM 21988]
MSSAKPQPKTDDDMKAVLERWPVSRETQDRLAAYAALVRTWQKHINLVAPSTVPTLWSRHIEDGLWLDEVAGPVQHWVDIGSGGGFPGLVLACFAAERAGHHVDLVEANAKKSAFLRTVIRELALPATVHCQRIEAAGPVLGRADAISARALASLDSLLGLVSPSIQPKTVCYFLKGRAHEGEVADATAHWHFDMVKHPSRTEAESVILEIGNCRPMAA